MSGQYFTQSFVSDFKEMREEVERLKRLGWNITSVSGDKLHGWVITAERPKKANAA